MALSFATKTTPGPRTQLARVDPARGAGRRAAFWGAWAVLAGGFVLIGGGNLDPGPIEARLGLSAREAIGPFGNVFGYWEPSLLPGQVIPSRLWTWGEGGTPTTASIRWPAAIAAVLIGLIVARRVSRAQGARAGLLASACVFGGLAMIDRSAGAGLDLLTGLAVVGALDRLLSRGSGWVAGLWAALAVITGGWTPLLVILLPVVVLGRPRTTLSAGLLLPPLLAFAAWSAWALSTAPADAWGAAVTLPLTRAPSWFLAPGVLALGLPWTPFALLCAWGSVRSGWTAPGRALAIGWLQVVGVSLLAGTLIPGLATAAKVPAIVGLAVAAAFGLESAWSGRLSTGARRVMLGLSLAVVVAWVALAVLYGGYLAAAVSYYRTISIVLMALALVIGTVALASAWYGEPRWALGAVLAVAVCLKLAHWGVYVPEWNYRNSQGPWGRAIGQWVPPTWPIYTFHAWRPDLAFATERAVRQLPSEKVLKFRIKAQPVFVLLLEPEFRHWPESAPKLIPVRTFHDQRGDLRVLARTEGDMGIRPPIPDRE